MTLKEASNQIKELLDALPQKKTNKEKLLAVFKIKVLLEIIEEPLKKSRDKEAASAAKKRIIKKALRQFLGVLDKIFENHEEVGDTDVREKMYDAIHKGYIKPRSGYTLPTRFGMFSDRGDDLVHAAIQKFLTHPEVVAARKSLKTPEARLNAFQDNDVESSEGTTCFEYFGHTDKPDVA